MRNEFRPGAISTRQAGLLNELLELSEQWRRMTVAPPLYLKRIAGIPCITAGAVAGTVLAKITGHDASSPPVHTAVQQTAAASGAAADAAPAVTYTQVFFPLGGRALETGTLVALVAVADSANRYWAFPLQVGFPARLTTAWSGATGYSWTLLVRTGLTLAPASPEITFSGAITPDVDTTLTAGTDGWMEPDPTGAGMIFLPAPVDTEGDCKGCGWMAGMGLTRGLLVTVNGVVTTLYLSTADGLTWTSTDLLTICGTDYTLTVHRNAGGVPTLTMTAAGSGGAAHTGQWNCCGCAFAKWDFNLQEICPLLADTGDACTNVVEVRVDATGPGVDCCSSSPFALGVLYTRNLPLGSAAVGDNWRWSVPAGNYTLTVTKTADVLIAQVNALKGPACNNMTTTLLSGQPVGVYPLVIAADGVLCVSILTTSSASGTPQYTIELTSP